MSVIKQELQWVEAEAQRCLYCLDAPCIKGCPTSVEVSQFIRHLRYGDVKSAKRVIKNANILGGICGNLCPSENLCQSKCTMHCGDAPIRIRDLQKFACDNADYRLETAAPNGKKIAVIGAGPAGLGCAAALAKKGYAVDIFEKNQSAAGVVAREIPDYRIAEEAIAKDLKEMECDLIKFHYGQEVKADDVKKLSESYDAVFIGVGLSKDMTGGIQADGKSIVVCSEYLADIKAGKTKAVKGTVCVIGGGDSAMDAARSALELGADKSILAYRRSRSEMPACDEEFLDTAAKGVELMYMVSPMKAEVKNGGVEVTFIRNRLVDKPGEARKGFESIEGSEFTLFVDQLVLSIGKKADGDFSAKADCVTGRIDGTNCFAGGDYLNGGATIVRAVSEGKAAAGSIDEFLQKA